MKKIFNPFIYSKVSVMRQYASMHDQRTFDSQRSWHSLTMQFCTSVCRKKNVMQFRAVHVAAIKIVVWFSLLNVREKT